MRIDSLRSDSAETESYTCEGRVIFARMTASTPVVSGVAQLPNGTHDAPEQELALEVILDALEDAATPLSAVDGLYMSAPRPWTDQKFFSTALHHRLGLETTRTLELSTGGTSGGQAFHAAVSAVRRGEVDTAVVFAIERNSSIETTDSYFEYALRMFDVEFQSPTGLSVPGVYAQSLQRYLHEYDVDREAVADIVVEKRENGADDPNTLFDDGVTRADVLEARPIADPLTLLECPAPCDGGAALVVSSAEEASDEGRAVEVAGIGAHHASSHMLVSHGESVTELPAVESAADAASEQAGVPTDEVDVYEPYAPFPHVEAMTVEAVGLAARGEGVDACLEGKTAPDGEFPISPSGGCIGRGHPPMVTPLLNHVEAVKQLRGTASTQIPDAGSVLTTAEHGHVNGATATIFRTEA